MSDSRFFGGENDGGGSRENDGGGRMAGPCGPFPYGPGPLPGWTSPFDMLQPGVGKIVYGTSFPKEGWDPAIRLAMMLQAFAADSSWRTITVPPPPGHTIPGVGDPVALAKAALRQDVRDLVNVLSTSLVDSEEDEIQFQHGDIISYFMKLLVCSPEVQPNTHLLMVLCHGAAAVVTRHFKAVHKRARPAQVVPSIDTLLPTPRHPSYPGGHALQAYLMATAVAEIAPHLAAQADKLAERISWNRVRAGIHFPADTKAAKDMRIELWRCLKTIKGVEVFDDVVALVAKAKDEHINVEEIDA